MQKRGIETEMLGWILLGLAVLAIVVISIGILSDKGSSYIDYIRQLFKFK